MIVVTTLLGLALGTILRNGAVATAALVAIVLVLPFVALVLPWGERRQVAALLAVAEDTYASATSDNDPAWITAFGPAELAAEAGYLLAARR